MTMTSEEIWDEMCPLGVFNSYDEDVTVGEVFWDLQYKILAFLFSAFLAFFCFDRLLEVESGMYRKMKHASELPFVNSTWLKIGLYVNIIASIFAVYGAFIVVFFSENALDMVLNSVALFFVLELDDLLVGVSDYEQIEQYIVDYHHVAKSTKGSVRTPLFLKSDKLVHCKVCYKKCGMGCRHCFRGCVCFCGFLYGVPYKALQWGQPGLAELAVPGSQQTDSPPPGPLPGNTDAPRPRPQQQLSGHHPQ